MNNIREGKIPSHEFLPEKGITDVLNKKDKLKIATELACDYLEDYIKYEQMPNKIISAVNNKYKSCNIYSYNYPVKYGHKSNNDCFVQVVVKDFNNLSDTEYKFHKNKPQYHHDIPHNYIFTIVYLFKGSSNKDNVENSNALGQMGIVPVKTRMEAYLSSRGYKYNIWYTGIKTGNVIEVEWD